MGRRGRNVGALLLGALAVLVVTLLGLAVEFAQRIVTPPRAPVAPLRVLRVNRQREPQTLVLSRGEDASLHGEFSFIFDGGRGHARVGEVLRSDRSTVERVLLREDEGNLAAGARGRITGWWFFTPDELGFRVDNIHIQSDVGALPTWQITPAGTDATAVAIHVHGRGARREEVLRGVAPVGAAGWSSLVMSYRNDPEAPKSSDARYGFGVAESADVEAAIEHAVAHGANAILLCGWSMGATAVLRAAELSEHRHLIQGVILESPALDWPGILRHQARRARVPSLAARAGTRFIERGSRLTGLAAPMLMSDLTVERCAAGLRVPVLVHVSDADTFVPHDGAVKFAQLRSDLVTLRRVSEGEHVKLWNVDRAGWEAATEQFAARVLAE